MDSVLQQLVDGLTLGASYALVAAGYALACRAMKALRWVRADALAVMGLVAVLAIARLAASPTSRLPLALSPSAHRIASLLMGVAAMAAVAWFRRATRIGIAQRAVEQDTGMATLLGVDVRSIVFAAVAMAAVLAAVGGALLALRGDDGFAAPVSLGFAIVTAAIFGGFGSLSGAIVGGILTGIADSVWTQTFGTGYRDAALFVVLILVLIFRPEGLLGRTSESM